MRFSKYHGTGNDFVMIEDLEDGFRPSAAFVVAACDRRTGVGADGVIRIAKAAEADFFMDYYNSSGEVAEMCGNGIRCLAKYVYERGITTASEIDVMTRAGLKHLEIDAQDGVVRNVTVDMGPPAFERKAIPMTGDQQARFVGQPFDVEERSFTATALSMGNPHCVLFLNRDEGPDTLAGLDVPRLGRSVEHRADFPNRTNVEFVVVEDGRIHVRVWERGSGETMACGTGACAALVACSLSGLTGRAAELQFPGGTLWVEWREDDRVYLTGPAVCVFEGEFDHAWLSLLQEGAHL
jgi:diaminopimelate epimerase